MRIDTAAQVIAASIRAAYEEGRRNGINACHPENTDPPEAWENSQAKKEHDKILMR